MQNIATHEHATELVAMYATALNNYTTFGLQSSDEDEYNDICKMYADDFAYNTQVITQFIKTRNLRDLEQGIMQQDTLPREAFIKVLHAIDATREELA